MKSEIIIFIFINLGICLYGQLDLVLPCIVERTKSNGTCKLLEECPSVIDDKKDFEHTRCGFAGMKEIVCCPETSKTTPSVENTLPRISQNKCEEYKSTVFGEVLSPSFIGVPQKKLSDDKCTHNIVTTIIETHDAGPIEFPHTALIWYGEKEKPTCVGTLISDEYVLVSAICARWGDGLPKYVRLGELKFNKKESANSEEFNVSTVIIHPKNAASLYHNNIALFKLSRKVELNSYKRPACLPTKFDYGGGKAISTGLYKSYFTEFQLQHLRKTVVDIYSFSECNATYSEHPDNPGAEEGIIADAQICAGSRHGVDDPGLGDYDGPLQIYHPDQYCMYTIIGVCSFGVYASYQANSPGVYERVYPHLDWIENIVWKNDS